VGGGAAGHTPKLTSRPGTATTRRTVFASRCAATFSSARAAASSAAASASAGTVTWARTLPLTWTATCTVSSTSQRSSASGNGAQASDCSWPSRAHSSSAMCGASGATISTSGSATDRGTAESAP
jgi:hypothetical protein